MKTSAYHGKSARLRILLAGALIGAAGLLAYHNSFKGPFIFDDLKSIPGNPEIRRLWPIWEPLSPPAEGQAVQRRPLVNLSLALNYALGGLEVRGYHIFNLAVHILTGLVLFGVLRRTLLAERLARDFGQASWLLALICTLIWLIHPLQTEAVTYVIQRTELLAGLFYLLSLYSVIRGAGSPRSVLWYAGAVVSCLLGMGSKEVVVSAPLVILIYDRIFLSGSFKELFRRRRGLYIGLAATWGLLIALIPHGREGTAILGSGSASLDYAATQFEALTNYLRLCFWPAPLILDYGSYQPTSFWQALPYAILIVSLLGATILALWYRPGRGFLGLWFFSILAPSSSFVPLLAQATAEKRMYLSLAAVVVAVVLCVYSAGRYLLGRWVYLDGRRTTLGIALSCVLAGSVIVVFGRLTVIRNHMTTAARWLSGMTPYANVPEIREPITIGELPIWSRATSTWPLLTSTRPLFSIPRMSKLTWGEGVHILNWQTLNGPSRILTKPSV